MDKTKLFRPRGYTSQAEIDGQTFYFRPMPAEDRVALADIRAGDGKALTGDQQLSIGLTLVIGSVVDENGVPTFDETDAPQLRKLPGVVFDALVRESMAANNISTAATEEAAKN